MDRSIFPKLSLDRSIVRWEDFIHQLTPVESIDGVRFKREDFFAPLGYGGINGSKVRQILYLVRSYLAEGGASPGLILAGSVKSPQLGRVAAVAKHFGIPSHLVIASELSTAIRNENVRAAASFGATFSRAAAPYNPSLQKKAREVAAQNRSFYLMEYGLSVEGCDQRIERFYRFGAEQTANLPDDIETVFMPAGSCNATLGLLYGIALNRPKALREVVLFGIGPTRIEWFEERLGVIKRESGVDVGKLFERDYVHHPELTRDFQVNRNAPYLLQHFDLHSTKFASYQDEMPASWQGLEGCIDLHPTYEGKMLTYILRNPLLLKKLTSGKTLFWIVGSEPRWEAMEPNVVDYLRSES